MKSGGARVATVSITTRAWWLPPCRCRVPPPRLAPRGIDPVVPPPRTTPNQITGEYEHRASERTMRRDRPSLASLASKSTLYRRA